MSFLIGFLTVVLVLNCLLLILLVLIQLPKKEAGAGIAFGGAATDALFGAGSGNALTKITKYATGIFFGLTILLSLLNAHVRNSQSTIVIPDKPRMTTPATTTPATTPAAPTAPATAPTPSVPTEAPAN